MNKTFWFFICLVNFCVFGFSQTIADCKNPEGFAYYHLNTEKNKKNDFEKDKITGGMLSIKKIGDKAFDLIVVDSRKK